MRGEHRKMAKYKRGRVREEKWLSMREEENNELCEKCGKMTKY